MEQYLLFNHSDFPVLSTLILLPLAGAIVCLFIRNETFLKLWGLAVTTTTMALSLPLYFLFDQTSEQIPVCRAGAVDTGAEA